MMERRNKPAEPMWYAEIAIPGGWRRLTLNELEASRYNMDPDAYAAALCGLTKFEYLQWVDLDGAPLCGHRTKSGDLCRNIIGPIQLDAREWKARHRKLNCVAHGGERSKRK